MGRGKLLVRILALTWSAQSASAASFEGQFDLVCVREDSGNTHRYQIDIRRGLYCPNEACTKRPPREIARVEGELIILADSMLPGGVRALLIFNSASDELTYDFYGGQHTRAFRASCHREAFTPFPAMPPP